MAFGIASSAATGDFLLDVARGLHPGFSLLTVPGRSAAAIATTQLQDITQVAPADGVFARPGGAQLELVSSNVNDTVLGTGAQTVEITYLDVNFDQQQEILSMDGQTPVLTVATDIEDIQWMHVVTLGGIANQTALGAITLRAIADTPVYETIAAGGNQSLSARYKIPNGFTGYILKWRTTAVTKQVDFRLRANVDRFSRAVIGPFLFQDASLQDVGSSPDIHLCAKIPMLGTVKISGLSVAGGGGGSCAFDLLLVDNNV